MADSNAKRDEAIARICKRAAELLIENEDMTLAEALRTADVEDLFIYGDSDGPTPKGILNA